MSCYKISASNVRQTKSLLPTYDMLGSWRIKATAPGDDQVSILVQRPHLGEYFCATLMAKRVPSSVVSDHTSFFWLMPHRVALWIYWHALKLWWKGVPFIQHPWYANPAYREEASLRDQKLNSCKVGSLGIKGSCSRDDGTREAHEFSWTDVKWPWA